MSSNADKELNDIFLTLYPLMQRGKVGMIVLNYNGSGDSGQVEIARAEDSDGENMDEDTLRRIAAPQVVESQQFYNGSWVRVSKEQDVSVADLAESIGYAMLNRHAGGWEINEGSHGELYITLDPPSVQLNHIPFLERCGDSEDGDDDDYEYETGSEEVTVFEPDLSPMTLLNVQLRTSGGE